ncbi:hypothetical protein LT679_01730 [Mucilaginibacter roseus]|uniref:DUF1080 domain-containing protein n=1 Tax=Mucilaginibacter roseus TaxID=1528868 RepID=A0ABS8TZR8_9SPHI|nr:hypothetical protein [Mucilaginibacter roseus]MCD8739308.1 hypothetical protein [Mucilaginibacter roseus]
MRIVLKSIYIFSLMLLPCSLLGQNGQTIKIADLYKKARLRAVNRDIANVQSNDGTYLNVSESKKEGIVWLPFKDFQNGTIEVEMRGKDVFQRSFIGIAFHGQDDITYDAVYCRPFNFFSADSVRRIHAVQYISQPDFTWERLRKEKNAMFEKEIVDPPDPNGWFTLKLVVDNGTVKAYINNAAEASLVVQKLNDRTWGKIGVFTADSSGGDFKTIKVNYSN